MKPIRLRMKNFITYKDETLDFSELDNSVFLITGKTGAGKTTIFDAMMFALYGEASGSSRDARSMYSNFADKREQAFVELEFEHHAERYKVTRSIGFKKTRGTEIYEYNGVDAELQGNEIAVKGSMRVTKFCEKLIGLDANQFKRIVMLAQGEFRKFLESGDTERKEILKKLFDVSAYTRYQNLICAAAQRLEDMRKEYHQKRMIAMQGFTMPNDISEEEARDFHSKLPEVFSAALDALIARETQQLSDVRNMRSDVSEQIRNLGIAREKRIQDNKLLDALEKAQKQYEDFIGKRAEMERGKQYADTVERVLRNVKPCMDACDTFYRERQTAQELLNRLGEELNRQKTAHQTASETLERNKPRLEQQRTECEIACSDIEKEFSQYDVYAARQNALNIVRKSIAEDERAVAALTQAREQNTVNIGNMTERLNALKDVDVQSKDAESMSEKVREQMRGMADLRGRTRQARESESALAKAMRNLSVFLQKKEIARDAWYQKDKAYSEGVARELAEKLGKTLETQDAACPVCHTPFARGRYTFAVQTSDFVRKEDVECAKTRYEDADRQFQQANMRVETAKTALAKDMEQIMTAAKVFFPNLRDWSELTDALLNCRARELEDECARIDEAYAKLRRLQAESKELRKALDELQAQVQRDAEQLNRKNESLQENRRKEAGIAAELQGMHLTYANAGEAKRKFNVLKRQLAGIEEQLKSIQQAFSETQKAVAGKIGEIGQTEKALQNTANALRDSSAKLETVLRENGFGNRMEAERHVRSEEWLREANRAYTRYCADLENAERDVKSRAESAKGLQRTDVSETDAQIRILTAREKQCAERENALNGLLSKHEDTKKAMQGAETELRKTENAYKRLKNLSAISGGKMGGNVDFSGYVLGVDFKEVLEKANVRLNTLSDGHFELQHRIMSDDKRKLGGLGIEVLDRITEKTEKSGSLSGGEGFMTSLALALGLADVVQARAGGISMDTIFIDEGFGTLDEDVCQNAIHVLKQLSNGSRMVGMISHVSELNAVIPTKIAVTFDAKRGSHTEIISE